MKQAAYQLISQTQQKLCLYTRDLDPYLLSNRHIERAVANIAKSSRTSEVRILVFDVPAIQSSQHRLISVAQSLSSYVKIKRVADDYHHLPFSFYLADNSGILYRPIHTQYTGEAWFNHKIMVNEKQKLFDDIWEQSQVASELRALSL